VDVDKFKFTPRIQRLNELEVCPVMVKKSYEVVTVTGYKKVYNDVKMGFVSSHFALE
jgi:hypothetical protein